MTGRQGRALPIRSRAAQKKEIRPNSLIFLYVGSEKQDGAGGSATLSGSGKTHGGKRVRREPAEYMFLLRSGQGPMAAPIWRKSAVPRSSLRAKRFSAQHQR